MVGHNETGRLAEDLQGEMMKNTATLLRTQCDALRALPPEQFKTAVLALWEYEMDGKEPEDPVAAMAVGMAKPLIDERSKRSQAGKKAAETRWGDAMLMRSDAMLMRSDAIVCDADAIECDSMRSNAKRMRSYAIGCDPNAIRCHEVESRKKKVESKKDKKSIGRFAPPTTEDVRQYVAEKGYQVDAERFVDFYASKNWMVGKNKMADWKAAVRNWARSQRQESTTKGSRTTNRFNNFEPSGTDWDAVADRIMGAQDV